MSRPASNVFVVLRPRFLRFLRGARGNYVVVFVLPKSSSERSEQKKNGDFLLERKNRLVFRITRVGVTWPNQIRDSSWGFKKISSQNLMGFLARKLFLTMKFLRGMRDRVLRRAEFLCDLTLMACYFPEFSRPSWFPRNYIHFVCIVFVYFLVV